MYISALFTEKINYKKINNKCLAIDELSKKMWYTHIAESYSALQTEGRKSWYMMPAVEEPQWHYIKYNRRGVQRQTLELPSFLFPFFLLCSVLIPFFLPSSFLVLFLPFFSLFLLLETWSLQLLMPLLSPTSCWDWKCAPPFHAYNVSPL